MDYWIDPDTGELVENGEAAEEIPVETVDEDDVFCWNMPSD